MPTQQQIQIITPHFELIESSVVFVSCNTIQQYCQKIKKIKERATAHVILPSVHSSFVQPE